MERGFLFRVTLHPEGFWMLFCRPLSSPPPSGTVVFFLLSVLGPLGLIGLSGRTSAAGGRPSLSLTLKILGLFLVAVVIPVSLLVNTALGAFREKAGFLERRLVEYNQARARAVDEAFRRWEEDNLSFYRRCRNAPGIREGDPQAFRGPLQEFRGYSQMFRSQTWDVRGRLIANTHPWPDVDRIWSYFYQNVVERHLGLPCPVSNSVERVARDLVKSPQTGFGEIGDDPDSLRDVLLGRGSFMWYWDIFRPEPGKPVAVIAFTQDRSNFVNSFLHHTPLENVRVFSHDLWSWTPDAPPTAGEKALMAQAMQNFQPSHQVMREGGRTFMVSAFPSSRIRECGFMARTDTTVVRPEFVRLRSLFRLTLVFSLLLAGLFAWVIARSVLARIAHLSGGVERMRRKEFVPPVPGLGADELGRVGAAFNALLAEFRELDMAGRVQKSLVPLTPPPIPGYGVSVFYQPTSEVGGDFAELQPRPDGKILVGIADVTGHGIPAALSTAMAKAQFFLSARENQPLAILFERLQQTVVETLKKRRFMTVFAGILDPVTHEFEWSPAGHPFPVLRRPDGTIRELGESYTQIGFKSRHPRPVDRFVFQPGDTLFLFTDGLPEATDQRNEPFGYERVHQVLANPGSWSAKRVREIVLDVFAAHIGDQKPDDDICLVIIQRLPETIPNRPSADGAFRLPG